MLFYMNSIEVLFSETDVGAWLWSDGACNLVTDFLYWLHFPSATAWNFEFRLCCSHGWCSNLCCCISWLLWSLVQESLPSHNSNNYLNICSNLFNALLRLNLWNQYFILVAILCGTELTCGVLGFLYSEEVSLTLKQELLTGIQAHYNTSPLYNGITFAWNHIQQQVNLHFSKSKFLPFVLKNQFLKIIIIIHSLVVAVFVITMIGLISLLGLVNFTSLILAAFHHLNTWTVML